MPNAPTLRPALCPSCGKPLTLIVASSFTITTQVHTRRGCNATLYYRCWIERGLPVPRVEFLDEANATKALLDKKSGRRPTTAADVSPRQSSRLPPMRKVVRARSSGFGAIASTASAAAPARRSSLLDS